MRGKQGLRGKIPVVTRAKVPQVGPHTAYGVLDTDLVTRTRRGTKRMSGRPALVRERDTKAVIRAAKKEGATKVEIRWGNASAVIHLGEQDQKPVEPDEEIKL